MKQHFGALALFAFAPGAMAQVMTDNLWQTSLWGSRVWNRTHMYERLSVHPFSFYDFKTDGRGGPNQLSASSINRWPRIGPVEATAGGHANNSNFTVHAYADTVPEISGRTSNGIEFWKRHRGEVIVEVWDTIVVTKDNNLAAVVPFEIEIEGSSSPTAKVRARHLVTQTYPPSSSSWSNFIAEGHNGKIVLGDSLYIAPLTRELQDMLVGIQLRLDVSTELNGDGGYADFGNSIHLRMNLPPGVRVRSSASGAFAPRPVPARVAGTLSLQSFGGSLAGMPATAELYQNGVRVETLSTFLSPTGGFNFGTERSGPHEVRIRAWTGLSKSMGVVNLVSRETRNASVSLRNGDITGDNEIGAADFSALAASYDRVKGNQEYSPRADLNGDQEIGAADFSILAANYDEVGD